MTLKLKTDYEHFSFTYIHNTHSSTCIHCLCVQYQYERLTPYIHKVSYD